MGVIEINSDTFKSEVLDFKDRVLVDFNADWCGPCQMIKPILEELDIIKVVSVNVDNEEDLAREYGVMSIPCLVLFDKGVEINRTVGFKSKEEIERFVGE
jgi:thioredoxin 1